LMDIKQSLQCLTNLLKSQLNPIAFSAIEKTINSQSLNRTISNVRMGCIGILE